VAQGKRYLTDRRRGWALIVSCGCGDGSVAGSGALLGGERGFGEEIAQDEGAKYRCRGVSAGRRARENNKPAANSTSVGLWCQLASHSRPCCNSFTSLVRLHTSQKPRAVPVVKTQHVSGLRSSFLLFFYCFCKIPEGFCPWPLLHSLVFDLMCTKTSISLPLLWFHHCLNIASVSVIHTLQTANVLVIPAKVSYLYPVLRFLHSEPLSPCAQKDSVCCLQHSVSHLFRFK